MENYKPSELKMVGVVVGMMRKVDVTKKDEIEARAPEITAVCSDCGKKEKGNRRFLKAEGWQLKEDSQRCVRCW